MYRRTKQLTLTDNMRGLNIFKNIMLDGRGGGGVTPLLQRLSFSSQKGRWEILTLFIMNSISK